MPGRAQTGRRATPRASHGDVTGNNAIKLRAEHADAVRDAQNRMSGVNLDPGDQPPIDLSDEAVEERREADEVDALGKTEDLSRTGLDIVAHPRVRPRRSLRSVSREGKYDPNKPVRIHFNDDYPGVTLGKNPKNGEMRVFDFERGRPYDVPQWVADHLAEKEMLV